MFKHAHPYPPFIPQKATKLIVGTLPPPRFTMGNLNQRDVDFCYGSSNGLLWPILDRIFNLSLVYENSEKAIEQRRHFLIQRKIGVCDIVASCQREKIDASDLGMQQVVLRDLIGILKQHPQIDTLLFTGGNSKNGPEYFFRKLLKQNGMSLTLVSNQIPRIHQVDVANRIITTVSLTAPSGAANRSIGSLDYYKQMKQKNPAYTTLDYRVEQYAPYF